MKFKVLQDYQSKKLGDLKAGDEVETTLKHAKEIQEWIDKNYPKRGTILERIEE